MGIIWKKKDSVPSPLSALFSGKDRYISLKLLGEGGFAQVHSFFDRALNRVIAVKELKPSCLKDPDLLNAFVNEAKLISFLDHPGIVSVFDTFLAGPEKPCYTMQLVEGRTLSSLLIDPVTGSPVPLPFTRALEIFMKMCETLAYAHDRGVIHLDLKPDNIMIGRYGEVLIMDWGSAKICDERPYKAYLGRFMDEPGQLSLKKENESLVLGTPSYMAPEQFKIRRNQCTPAADVFAAGIILYQMLTGTNPFWAVKLEDIRHLVENRNPPPVHEINVDIPLRLSQICEKALEKSTVNRYRNCHELVEDIKQCHDSCEAFISNTYNAGEVIFEEGAIGEYAFIIVSGRVEISKIHDGAPKVLAVLGKNEIVGELAIFSKQPRSATARAIEPTTIRIMNKVDVERELDKLSPWVGRIITGLSNRFIGLNEQLLKREK
jgi:eukaryotic-like serine/threonine-protein kinase